MGCHGWHPSETSGTVRFLQTGRVAQMEEALEQYRSASGLDAEADPRQVDTLLYCMGEEADSVLASTHISAEDRKKYDAVVGNIIFERAKFNRRSQREGESAEQYITELYELIDFCEYGGLKEEMLRDRLVVGIQDLTLSEKLRTDPELTLEKAKTMIRQKAAAKEHRRELQGDKEAALNRLRRGNGPRSSKWKQGGTGGASSVDNRSHHNRGGANKCTRCGRNKHHPGEGCPALGATCHQCKKKGHFRAQCFFENSCNCLRRSRGEQRPSRVSGCSDVK